MGTVYHVTIFGIKLNIRPVALSIFGWDIYWYGILIAVGFALALWYAMRRAKAYKVDTDRLADIILVTAPVSLLAARLYYIVFDPSHGVTFAQFFDIHNGGLAIYGAVIGAAAGCTVMSRVRKVPLPALLDIGALGFLLAQGIGRWGNFFNQEAYGAVTGSAFWGMTSDKITTELGVSPGTLVHPCFLYESLWLLLGFAVLHFLSKRRRFDGEIALAYCVWNGFGRALIEGLRTDSLRIGGLGGVRVSQLLAALLFAAGLTALLILRHKFRPAENEDSYAPLFADMMAEMEAEESPVPSDSGTDGEIAADAPTSEINTDASVPSESAAEALTPDEDGSDQPSPDEDDAAADEGAAENQDIGE